MENLKSEIKERLLRLYTLPGLIAGQVEETNHQQEIKDLENDLKDMMIGLSQEAAMKVDPETGKNLFTNQATRDAEARRMAKINTVYKEYQKQVTGLKDTQFRATTKLEELRNEFSMQKVQINMLRELLKTENIKLAAETKTVKVRICHVTGQ